MITAIAIMIFTSLFLAAVALSLGIRAARQSPAAELKRRMKRLSESDETAPADASSSELLRRQTTSSEKRFHRLPMMGMVSKWVDHSGVRITPFYFVFLSVLAALSGFIAVVVLTGNLLAALLAMLLTGCAPSLYLRYCKQKRMSQFDDQFPDVLNMLARSLRAGHSLSGAIELVGQEMPDPTGILFKTVYEQQLLGLRITDALTNLLEKIESMDLHFFVTIIRINYETGGNLAEILDKLADTIRSRLQIRRQVKVYTAQGRLTGYILTGMPVVVFFVFYVMNPGYMSLFFTERICIYALIGAALMLCFGFFIIRKIIEIRI